MKITKDAESILENIYHKWVSHKNGRFVLRDYKIASDLGWEIHRVRKGLIYLKSDNMIRCFWVNHGTEAIVRGITPKAVNLIERFKIKPKSFKVNIGPFTLEW